MAHDVYCEDMDEKVVYLMRGLPSCGKSTTARRLAGETGVICETDEYFYTQVGDDPTKFDYRKELMGEARRWNFERFKRAVDEGRSPVIVDRGNSRSTESKVYAQYALDRGYRVELREPESEWWQEIRVLLKYKELTKPALDAWAEELSKLSKQTHRVPTSTIRRWMAKWKWDLTLEDILAYESDGESASDNDEEKETAAKRARPKKIAVEEGAVTSETEVLGKAEILRPGEKSPFL